MNKSTRGRWGRTIRFVCVIGTITIASICGPVNLKAQQTRAKTDTTLEDLHQIGLKILDVVLKNDVATVLSYEPAKDRAEHEISLEDKSSDLYCFLINSHSSCTRIPGGGSWPPSVFEVISGARRPGVTVIGLGTSRLDTKRYAILMLYDRSAISEQSIRSTRFICAPANFHKFASWTFKLVDGKWESRGELFDYETDGPC
jgi:hypothetical protein